MKYVSLKESKADLIVSRSKFIAFALPVDSEEKVNEILGSLRKSYYDSTHVCYAAIWDERGNYSRLSDDGEPSGTAGAPIMEAIKGAGLTRCMVAVVRYFGGTKLGTGGLTRAYSSVAADAIAKAEKIEFVLCDTYCCVTDFATFKRLSSIPGIYGASFGDSVSFTYACPCGEGIDRLINRANGKITYVKNAQPCFKENTLLSK